MGAEECSGGTATCTKGAKCAICYTIYTSSLGHTGGTATCKDKAICTRCNQPYGDKNTSNHVGGTDVRDAITATCKTKGYSGDTWCLGCETIIASGSSTGLNASNHEGDTELRDVVTATCKTEGYTGDTYCLGCNTKIADGKSTGKDDSNHEGGTEVRGAKEATCTEEGYTGDTVWTCCDAVESKGETIKKLAHTLIKTARVEPTCKDVGTEEYWTCSVCKKMFSDAAGTAEITAPVSIPASGDGHKPGKPVKENITYTCVDDGGYDEVVYCTLCGKELSREHVNVKATGHDYQPWKWHVTITRMYFKCTKCGHFYWLHNSESWNMKPGLVRYANGDAVDYKASATGPDRDGVLTIMPIKHTERDDMDDICLYMTPDDVYVWVWEKMNKIELVRDGVTLSLDPREITPEMFGLEEKEKPDYYIFTLTPSGKDGWLVKAEALVGEKRIPAEELKGITLTAAGKETEITANGLYKAE